MGHALNWFEIPTTDIQRGVKFYSTVLDVKIEIGQISPGDQMAVIPHTDGVGGALIQGEGYVPSADGTVVYLACGPDLRPALGRVEAAGGKILVPRHRHRRERVLRLHPRHRGQQGRATFDGMNHKAIGD